MGNSIRPSIFRPHFHRQLCPRRLANVSYFSQWQLHVGNRVKLVFHTSSFITFHSVPIPCGNHLFLIVALSLRVMLARGKVRLGVLRFHMHASVRRLGEGGSLVILEQTWGRVFPDLWPRWRGSIIIQKKKSYHIWLPVICRAELVAIWPAWWSTDTRKKWNKRMRTKMRPSPSAAQSTAAALDLSSVYSLKHACARFCVSGLGRLLKVAGKIKAQRKTTKWWSFWTQRVKVQSFSPTKDFFFFLVKGSKYVSDRPHRLTYGATVTFTSYQLNFYHCLICIHIYFITCHR